MSSCVHLHPYMYIGLHEGAQPRMGWGGGTLGMGVVPAPSLNIFCGHLRLLPDFKNNPLSLEGSSFFTPFSRAFCLFFLPLSKWTPLSQVTVEIDPDLRTVKIVPSGNNQRHRCAPPPPNYTPTTAPNNMSPPRDLKGACLVFQ